MLLFYNHHPPDIDVDFSSDLSESKIFQKNSDCESDAPSMDSGKREIMEKLDASSGKNNFFLSFIQN